MKLTTIHVNALITCLFLTVIAVVFGVFVNGQAGTHIAAAAVGAIAGVATRFADVDDNGNGASKRRCGNGPH